MLVPLRAAALQLPRHDSRAARSSRYTSRMAQPMAPLPRAAASLTYRNNAQLPGLPATGPGLRPGPLAPPGRRAPPHTGTRATRVALPRHTLDGLQQSSRADRLTPMARPQAARADRSTPVLTVTPLGLPLLARGARLSLPLLVLLILNGHPQRALGEPPVTPAPVEVLATFDSGQITRADFEQVVARKRPQERAALAAPGGKEALLAALIDYDLLVLEAERRGYARDVTVVAATERAAAEGMLVARFAVDPATIPKEQIAEVFEQEKANYSRPYVRRASQIELASEAEALALIRRLRSEQERERFAQLAVEHSLDERTRRQGGQLGYFASDGRDLSGKPTGVPLELVAETFKLERIGDISAKPVKRINGRFSVIQLTADMEAVEADAARHEPRERYELSLRIQADRTEALVKQLESELAPEVHPELISSIVLPAAGAPDAPTGFDAAPRDPRAPAQLAPPDEW